MGTSFAPRLLSPNPSQLKTSAERWPKQPSSHPSAASAMSRVRTDTAWTKSFAHISAHTTTLAVYEQNRRLYLGAKLDEYVLLPGRDAAVYPTDFADWLAHDVSAPAR